MNDEVDLEATAHHGSAESINALSRPATWLGFAIAGLLLVCGGLVWDTYRHGHSAAAGSLISWSNPGTLVALSGIDVVAMGLLVGLSLLVFQSADSPEAVVRRGVGVLAAWVAVIGAGVGALTYVATTGVTIGHERYAASSSVVVPATISASAGPSPAATSVPGANQRVTLRGTLTLDGAPFDARFLGARVTTADGLAGACQGAVVPVTNGRYEIPVLAEAEVHGCGVPGARIMLWAFVNDRFLYTGVTAPWPDDGTRAIAFDANFSTAAPQGLARSATEFKGYASDRRGTRLPAGTRVEAFVGDVRCANSSLQSGDYSGYILVVAGPDAVPGCVKDATLTFRIDGQPAIETARNDLGTGSSGHELNLTLR